MRGSKNLRVEITPRRREARGAAGALGGEGLEDADGAPLEAQRHARQVEEPEPRLGGAHLGFRLRPPGVEPLANGQLKAGWPKDKTVKVY